MVEVFAISPASAKPLWVIAAICVLLAGVLVLLAYVAFASRHSSVEIGDGQLRIVGDLWGRSIPIASLELASARVVDLEREGDLSPRRRTFGTSLPGYASGWFRLRNGEKALAYLTDRRRVVYLPTREGYSLLLSMEAPDPFLASLSSQAERR